MKLTPEQIREIAERCDKATSAPWKWSAAGYIYNDPTNRIAFVGGSGDIAIADCDFISHARQDIPALVAHIAQLEAENAALKTAVGQSLEMMSIYTQKIEQLEAEREDEKEVDARIDMVCMFNDQLQAENAELRQDNEHKDKEMAAAVRPDCDYRQEEENGDTWNCSVCGEEWDLIDGTPFENNMHYCPQCGSRITSTTTRRFDWDASEYVETKTTREAAEKALGGGEK